MYANKLNVCNMNGYNLLRDWYNFKFSNPSKTKSIHSDFYCYLIDLWNRLGQKDEFGLPTSVTMELLGIGSYNTYKKVLNDLIEFGFVKLIVESKNQHQSKIVALSKYDKASDEATDKALDKAHIKASDEATDTIIKQVNKETKNNKTIPTYTEFLEHAKLKKPNINREHVKAKYDSWVENGWKDGNDRKITNWRSKLSNTVPHIPTMNTDEETVEEMNDRMLYENVMRKINMYHAKD